MGQLLTVRTCLTCGHFLDHPTDRFCTYCGATQPVPGSPFVGRLIWMGFVVALFIIFVVIPTVLCLGSAVIDGWVS